MVRVRAEDPSLRDPEGEPAQRESEFAAFADDLRFVARLL
jgi:hypothetical protein